MTYIKINKPSLDYHQYSDFHIFTMNNFVRNVMKNGKYKKAVKIVRLGLLDGLKKLFYKLRLNDARVARTYRTLKRTRLNRNIKKKMEAIKVKKDKEFILLKKKVPPMPSILDTLDDLRKDVLVDNRPSYYVNLSNKIKINNNFIKNKEKLVSPFSFTKIFNMPIANINVKQLRTARYENTLKTVAAISSQSVEEKRPANQYDNQYKLFYNIKFKKIYSKKPKTHFWGIRNLTVFDMVVQVYTMLTGAWYMRKSKVSGRTILIPSPLRPYRRVTTVTKMLLKGIRKRRREDRFDKKAMIQSIGTEFYWLLLYNGVQYGSGTMIDNSYVWNAKTDSHKELVANLKNIKHLKYF
jgi:ribosomal protein S7